MSTSRESDGSRPPLTEDDAPVVSPQAPLSLVHHHRQCWREGKRLSVEAFLEEFPPPTLGDDDLLDLIYNEIVLREENGERPELDEYLKRFPEYAADLRAQFDVHRALQSGQPFTLNLSSASFDQTPGPDTHSKEAATCHPPDVGAPAAGAPRLRAQDLDREPAIIRPGLADARGLRHPGSAR